MTLWNEIHSSIWTLINLFAFDKTTLCINPFESSTSANAVDIDSHVSEKLSSPNQDFLPSTQCNLKEPWSYVIVRCSNYKNALIEWNKSVNYEAIVRRICELTGVGIVAVDKIYYGDPPILLDKDEVPLPLNDFAEIFVEVKKTAKKKSKNRSPERTVILISFLHLLYEKSVGTNKFWQRLLKYPKMFSNSGPLYRLVVGKHGKQDGRHYSIPALLPKQTFVYSSSNDRLEICIPNVGHFEITENLREIILEKLKSKECEQTLAEIFDQPAPKTESCLNIMSVFQVNQCHT